MSTENQLNDTENEFDAAWDEAGAAHEDAHAAADDEPGEAEEEFEADSQTPDDQASSDESDDELARAEQRLRSTEGRVRKLEEQAEQYRRELEQLRGSTRQSEESSQDKDGSAEEEGSESADFVPPGMSKDEWDAIQEDLPDLARHIRAQHQELSTIKTQVGEVKAEREKELQRAQQQAEQEARQTFDQAIREAHSDYDAICQDMSPLMDWIEQQSPLQRRIYQEVVSSGSAEEIIDLLTDYKSQHKPASQASRKPTMAVRTRRGRPDLNASRARKDDFDAAWEEAVRS